MKKIILVLVFATGALLAYAQEKTDNSWLAGTWRGPGFDGTFEEIWSEPDAKGVSIGMFRYYDVKGEIKFYEFWILDETGLRLKHFDPAFIGWEEKDGFAHFQMIGTEPGKVSMKGLIYELTEAGTLKISLTLKKEGEVKTHVFELKKVG